MKKQLICGLLMLLPFLVQAQAKWEYYQTLSGHRAEITFLHFYQNYLFSGDKAGVLKIWKVDAAGSNASLIHTMTVHQAEVSHIEVSPNGQMFLTVGYDGYVKVFDAKTRQLKQSVQLNGSGAYADVEGLEATFASFSNNGQEIYAGGYNHKVVKISVATGAVEDLYIQDTYGLTCGMLLATKNLMAFGYGGEVRFIDTRTNQLTGMVLGAHDTYENRVCEINYYPSRDWLTVWLVSGSVQIYDLKNGQLLSTIPASKKQGSCFVGIAPQAGLLAAGNQPSGVIYDVANRKPMARLNKHTGDITNLAFHGQESILATGGNDYQVILWKDKNKLPDPSIGDPVVIIPPPTKKDPDDGDFIDEGAMVKGESFVLDGLQFDQSSYALRPDAKKELDKVLRWMKKYPQLRVSLEGHTSNEGNPAKNMQLSLRRVTSAKNYLAGNGIAEDRIETQGYGEEKPIADNSTPDGRIKNRRIELRILDL